MLMMINFDKIFLEKRVEIVTTLEISGWLKELIFWKFYFSGFPWRLNIKLYMTSKNENEMLFSDI